MNVLMNLLSYFGIMILSSVVIAYAADIWHVNVHESMVKNKWTYTPPAIERLVTKNLDPSIEPKAYWDFEREKPLTKGDLAVMIVKLLDKTKEVYQYRKEIALLKDDALVNVSPYFGWVETCLKYGYLNGDLILRWDTPSQECGFNPYQPVTREEFIVILIKLLNDMYPESLGEESILAPPGPEDDVVPEVIQMLAPLADFWPRRDGKYIPGILAEAIALNRKITQIKDISVADTYPGFILTAKKYLLEASPHDKSRAESFMSNVYGITSKDKIYPHMLAKRYWAALLFSKCFVGRFVPTIRKVAISGKEKAVDEPSAYGVFGDKWDLVGRVGTFTKHSIMDRVINVVKDNGEIVKLKVFDHTYIYTLCPHNRRIEKKIGKVYAPSNDIYEEDKDIGGVRGYKRFYWRPMCDNYTVEIRLDDISNTYRPPVKIYREATRAIGFQEGYKEADFIEKRKVWCGPSTRPQQMTKEINYFEVDIEKATDLHWGMYHNERVEITFVNEPCEYKTGKQFFNISPQKANELYKGKLIRVYFIPNRPEYSQAPVENYAGFIEITPDEDWTTWHGIRSNVYPITVKCWFDLTGKCVMIDTKFSRDIFKIDTDRYIYDADGMGKEVSPVLIPLGYKYFLSPARNTVNKLYKLQFCRPDTQRILEQQFYIQLDKNGKVRFLESDVLEEY